MITLIKILTWLASPIGVLVALSIVAGLLRLADKAPRIRLVLVVLAIGQLVFFASPWTATSLSQSLENKARALQTQNTGAPYTAILLLGGGITPGIPEVQPANAHEAFDRILYAAKLYHQGVAPRILASGGNSLQDRHHRAQSEAHAMRNALLQMGVPQTAILLEEKSLNTRQNMAFSAQLLGAQGLSGRIALVTSATHMPRAMANAQKAGLLVDAYPTDWTEPWAYRTFAQRWLPNAQSLEESERALKEWIARLAQY